MQLIVGKYISNYYTLKKYGDSYYKLTFHKNSIKRSGFECEELNQAKVYNRDVNEDKLLNNLVRAKSKVFEYAMCNDFDYFLTLTLDSTKYDRNNLNQYIKDLGQLIRNYRRKYQVNIQYILIPEQHKNGAWHMHGLIKGIPGEHLSVNSNGYMDWKIYSDKFGYLSIQPVKSKEAVAKYITKYIVKTLDVGGGVTEKNKKLYYASRGLDVSQKVREGTLTSRQLEKIPFEYENEYIGSLTIDKSKNPLHLLVLNNILDNENKPLFKPISQE